MAKLLMFCPCEKVIIDKEDGTTSLITILETVKVGAPPGKAMPDDAIAPFRWSVLSLWQPDPPDIGVQYEQKVEVVRPDDKIATEGSIKFQFAESRHRNVVNIVGFPVGQPGSYIIKLSIRPASEDEWMLVASYPIPVQYEELLG